MICPCCKEDVVLTNLYHDELNPWAPFAVGLEHRTGRGRCFMYSGERPIGERLFASTQDAEKAWDEFSKGFLGTKSEQ